MNTLKTMFLMVTLTLMLVFIGGLLGGKSGLTNALRKMEKAAEQIPINANPATAQMFIVNPLSGSGLLKLFSTHPPMEQRIARLEAMRSGS